MSESPNPRIASIRSQAALLACLLPAACGHPAGSTDSTPVAWWHQLEGGAIAAQRPPPPDADAPYPNLSTVPARPARIDPAHQAATTKALAADRADARYEAEQDPLAAAPARTTAGLFAPAAPLPAASPDAAGAALDAHTQPPATPAATPARPAASEPPPTRTAAASPLDQPMPEPDTDTTPIPAIPDAPPAAPVLAGVSIPVTVAHLPPSAPPPAAIVPGPLTASDRAALLVAFAPGSARLDPGQSAPLQALAFRRGVHVIEITGFGEADGADAQSQLAGVQLAIARARAIAAVLTGDGVPMAAMRLAGAAPGRGAAARLID